MKFFTHGGAGAVRHMSPKFDFFGKIIVGDYVYFGNNSLICPGVTIGSHVLIAAGSVVTKSIPDQMVVGGNPAKIICTIDEFYKKNSKFNTDTKGLSDADKKKILESLPDRYFITKPFMKNE